MKQAESVLSLAPADSTARELGDLSLYTEVSYSLNALCVMVQAQKHLRNQAMEKLLEHFRVLILYLASAGMLCFLICVNLTLHLCCIFLKVHSCRKPLRYTDLCINTSLLLLLEAFLTIKEVRHLDNCGICLFIL